MARTPKTDAAPTSGSAELDLALSAINKQFGEGAIMRIGEASKINIDVISTGSVAIDLALGVGGLPRGRIAEIYGPESSGKTTLCLSLIAQAQKNGGRAVFIDTEHALDPRYARILGVDVDNLESVVVRLLSEKGLHLATAESCTGGLVAKLITVRFQHFHISRNICTSRKNNMHHKEIE